MKRCVNPGCSFGKEGFVFFLASDNFCSECGEKLGAYDQKNCKCGHNLADSNKFCVGCGLQVKEMAEELDVGPMNLFEKFVYNEAKQLLADGTTAPEFSSRFFGPKGRLRELCSKKKDREEFIQTKLYKWLQAKLTDLRRREGENFEQEIQEAEAKKRKKK